MVGARALDTLILLASLGMLGLGVMAFLAMAQSANTRSVSPTTFQNTSAQVRPPNANVNVARGGNSYIAYQTADDHLNQAYNTLKKRLSAAGQSALTSEQKNWLRARDRIANLDDRVRFVEQRAQELDRRSR